MKLNFKKNVSVAMMVLSLSMVAVPSGNVYAATKSCSKSNCDFTVGKLCYNVTGKNSCTVTGLSNKGTTSSSCTIPSSVTCNGKTYKVTKIAKNAFNNCDNLTSVNVANSVKCIGNKAFANCNSLKSIKLSSNCTNFSKNVFSNCTSLNR